MGRLMKKAKEEQAKSFLVEENNVMVLKQDFLDDVVEGLFKNMKLDIEHQKGYRQTYDSPAEAASMTVNYSKGSFDLSQLEGKYGSINDIYEILEYIHNDDIEGGSDWLKNAIVETISNDVGEDVNESDVSYDLDGNGKTLTLSIDEIVIYEQ